MRVRILHAGVLAFIILASCRPSLDDLLLAAKQGKVEQIQRLLNRGVPITVADRAGETPLHLAARWGREDVAGVLLDRGAYALAYCRERKSGVSDQTAPRSRSDA